MEMPDAKKVIRGLEQFIADFKPFCGNKSDWQRVDDAIALLKAQEPVIAAKLQSKKYIGRTGIAYDGSCGNCNAYLMRAWRACPLCGKAVKWELSA